MDHEIHDVYTSDKQLLGKTNKRGNLLPEGEYHLAVIAVIINENGHLLMTKRSKHKIVPGKWECTGGSVHAGENSESAIKREIKEEIGIDIESFNSYGKQINSFIEDNAIFDVWYFQTKLKVQDVILQTEEVDDIKYVSRIELEEMINNDQAVNSAKYIIEYIEKGLIVMK